ncbi:MAG TPA: glycosyltransferase family 2 protein [Verrucomicrobiae bacterium]|nr:glycosyltransferase family 2 protein [Verrucomicrobiae bacterium]
MSDSPPFSELGTKPVDAGLPFARRRVGFPGACGRLGICGDPVLSVIVPLRNEALNVVPLAQQIFKALEKNPSPLELLFVDDASTDETWRQILEAQRADARVRPLRHLRHGGQSAALWTGLCAARGDVLSTLDGDLQNDPADVPLLLAQLPEWDLVCGVRARRMDNGVRRFSSGVARTARRLMLGVDFRDIGCNLRVMKRSVLQTLLPFDGLHRFLPLLAHDAGARVKEMPVAHHPRVAGQSKYGVWNRMGRGMYDLAMIAWYRKRQLANVAVVEHEPARLG